MDLSVRQLREADRPAAATLLDDLVGPGFWDFADADAGDADARLALGSSLAQAAAGANPTLHVRELAVSPHARRAGLASRLLARAEAEACALGARTAFAFGWLPAGRPEQDSVPFYAAAGYEPEADIAGFFAQNSLESGARCPYCGEPPCRCAVRPFVKRLEPAAG